jgi:VanZ family protein
LSAAIEFAQAFLPSRTPSVIDIAAETCGAAAGAALWCYLGAEIDALSAAAVAMLRRSTATERCLLLYCLIFGIAWLAPADFTLRPAEIGDKYLHQRLLLPFTPSPDAATRTELAAAVAAAIPLGIAALLCGCARAPRRSVISGTAIVAASLVVLEIAQITVFSRTTDEASLLAALTGALVGVAAAARRGSSRCPAASRTRRAVDPGRGVGRPGRAGRMVAVSPRARSGARRRADDGVVRAPFRWPSGPFDPVPGVAMAMVAGRWLRRGAPAPFIRLHTVMVLGLGVLTFLIFEAGRVLLSAARPTLLSVAIKTAAVAVALHAHGVPTLVTARRRRT